MGQPMRFVVQIVKGKGIGKERKNMGELRKTQRGTTIEIAFAACINKSDRVPYISS